MSVDILTEPRHRPARAVRLEVGTQLRRPWGDTRGDPPIHEAAHILRTWSGGRWNYSIENLSIYAVGRGPACGLYVPGCAMCGGDGCATCTGVSSG